MDHLIGIPYVNKGRDPSTGLDCWGLLRQFYREFMGIVLPSYTDEYEDAFDRTATVRAMDQHAPSCWIKVEEPRFGDGIRLRIDGSACHVGIYLGHSEMLHTQAGHDSVIDRIDGIRWKNRVVGFYRHIDAAGSDA